MTRRAWRGWAIADKNGRLVLLHDRAPMPYGKRSDARMDCDPTQGDKPVRVVMYRVPTKKRKP